MKTQLLSTLLSGVAVAVLSGEAAAQDNTPALQDVIIVTGKAFETATETGVSPQAAPLQGGDVTYLTARTPGGARIANGELSGQMQYRGLFGERLNLRVDGQRFASGGPNLMDPVFHYAPSPLVAQVLIDRGVSPVSAGPGLAGGADAVFKKIGYAESSEVEFGYDLSLGYRSVNESFTSGGVVGASTNTWRFNLLGALETAEDTEFPDGVIGGTAYDRDVFGVSAGAKLGFGELTLDLRRQNTGQAGNPPFPMDIQYFDTDFARLGYAGDFGGVHVTLRAHSSDVSHLMDNYSLRPAPMATMQRASFATARTEGLEGAIEFAFAGGELELGADTEEVDHNVTITNPNNADFFVSAFPEIDLKRTGGFAEWSGPIGPFETELGARFDNHEYDTGAALTGAAFPAMPNMLAMAFNTADRSGNETTYDLVARFWTPAENGFSWRGTLARKQQTPGYIQRFGWLPISASGGLADGNIYVGDLDLDPETAWIAEAGFDYTSGNAYFRPTVFVRQIDDYIQGVAYDDTPGVINTPVEMISNMNGDPTPMRWANVDARLYGLDFDAGYDFEGPLRLDGLFNYVRGERRDIDDNLYRVAPPNLALGLTWETEAWSATLEARAYAEQTDVSTTNSEAETDGYAVVNAYIDWDVASGIRLSLGVENLFDELYEDHLSGYNRNGYGDVSLGVRVPGPGRGGFIRLSLVG